MTLTTGGGQDPLGDHKILLSFYRGYHKIYNVDVVHFTIPHSIMYGGVPNSMPILCSIEG